MQIRGNSIQHHARHLRRWAVAETRWAAAETETETLSGQVVWCGVICHNFSMNKIILGILLTMQILCSSIQHHTTCADGLLPKRWAAAETFQVEPPVAKWCGVVWCDLS